MFRKRYIVGFHFKNEDGDTGFGSSEILNGLFKKIDAEMLCNIIKERNRDSKIIEVVILSVSRI